MRLAAAGTLARRDDRHDVGVPRRHIHLGQQAAQQKQSDHDRQAGHEGNRDQAQARRQVREHHRPDEPDAVRERNRGKIRNGRQEVGPEEEFAASATDMPKT